jgi:hypothetical protein
MTILHSENIACTQSSWVSTLVHFFRLLANTKRRGGNGLQQACDGSGKQLGYINSSYEFVHLLCKKSIKLKFNRLHIHFISIFSQQVKVWCICHPLKEALKNLAKKYKRCIELCKKLRANNDLGSIEPKTELHILQIRERFILSIKFIYF